MPPLSAATPLYLPSLGFIIPLPHLPPLRSACPRLAVFSLPHLPRLLSRLSFSPLPDVFFYHLTSLQLRHFHTLAETKTVGPSWEGSLHIKLSVKSCGKQLRMEVSCRDRAGLSFGFQCQLQFKNRDNWGKTIVVSHVTQCRQAWHTRIQRNPGRMHAGLLFLRLLFCRFYR